MVLGWLSAALAGASTAPPNDRYVRPIVAYRPRFEANTGRDGVEGGHVSHTTHRARVGAEIGQRGVSARVSIQDVRLWGQHPQTVAIPLDPNFAVHEAWARWQNDDLRVTVGRQEVEVHEERLLGRRDWRQDGLTYDGVAIETLRGATSAHVLFLVLADGVPDTFPESNALGSVRWGWTDAVHTVDGLAIVDVGANSGRLTVGPYIRGSGGILSWRGEAYLQAGFRELGDAQTSILAGMTGLRLTVTAPIESRPSVTAWYDLLTGDNSPTDTRDSRFDNLLGANHKFYGQHDIVRVPSDSAIGERGLQDLSLKLQVEPGPWRVGVDGHVFFAQWRFSTDASQLIGTELDAHVRFQLAESVALAGGGSVYKGHQTPQADLWAWTQISAAF